MPTYRGRTTTFLLALCCLVPSPSPAENTTHSCDTSSGWLVVDMEARPAADAKLRVKDGSIVFEYSRREPRVLVHADADLRGLEAMSLRLRSELDAALVLVVEDRDGARFFVIRSVKAKKWTTLRLAPADFRLGDDSPVRKERLEPERLGSGYMIVDFACLSREAGRNTLEIDSVQVSGDSSGPEGTRPEATRPPAKEGALAVDRDESTPPAGTRSFRMGFTGFPHDISLEAVEAARRFSKSNADILCHHIEGVPWAEALGGRPFPGKLLEEWKSKRKARPEGGAVVLAISPGRGDLKVADKGLPLPPGLSGKPYDDPLVKRAFLAYCRRAVAFFQPDYLSIGIEVNEIFQAGPEKWRAYAELHRHVYQEIRKEHSELPIFASFTLHGLLNLRGPARERMLGAFLEIMPHNDIVAVSFYPFIAGGTTDIDGALEWLYEQFDRFEKPYAIAETGEAADRLEFPGTGQIIHGTPEKQRAYYETLLASARERRFVFVISFLHRDYDHMWEKIRAHSPEVFMAWRDCGLVDEEGAPRPAFDVWKSCFALPLAR